MNVRKWLCLACLLVAVSVSAQQRNKAYEEYIKKYRELAVQ